MPKDVRQQMIEAGCIPPADVPDDYGNDRDDATMAPARTATPGPTPAAATLSLDEYLTLCAPRYLELADGITFGDFSSELAAEADRLEALTPPAQLSEWHLLNIEAIARPRLLLIYSPRTMSWTSTVPSQSRPKTIS